MARRTEHKVEMPADITKALAAEAKARGMTEGEFIIKVLRMFLYRRVHAKELRNAGASLRAWEDQNSDVFDHIEDIMYVPPEARRSAS